MERSVRRDPCACVATFFFVSNANWGWGGFELNLVLSFLVQRCGVFLCCLNLGGHIECWGLPVFECVLYFGGPPAYLAHGVHTSGTAEVPDIHQKPGGGQTFSFAIKNSTSSKTCKVLSWMYTSY